MEAFIANFALINSNSLNVVLIRASYPINFRCNKVHVLYTWFLDNVRCYLRSSWIHTHFVMHGNIQRHELVTWLEDMCQRWQNHWMTKKKNAPRPEVCSVRFMQFPDLSPHLDEWVSACRGLFCVWRPLRILGRETGGWCEAVYLNKEKTCSSKSTNTTQ